MESENCNRTPSPPDLAHCGGGGGVEGATLPLPADGATVVPFGEFVVEDEDPPQDESAFPTAPVAMLSFNSSGFNQT